MLGRALSIGLIGCLFASGAKASPTIELITSRLTAPPDTVADRASLRYGARVAIPLPSDDVSGTEIGLNARLNLVDMATPWFGFNFALGYQYWPASTAFKSSFNETVRKTFWGLLELGGTSWEFSTFHAALQLRFEAPLGGPVRPWLEIGPSGALVDPHVRGFEDSAGNVVSSNLSFSNSLVAGFSSSIGFDVAASPSVRLGLHATYDHLASNHSFGSDFGAFSVGAHVMFGR